MLIKHLDEFAREGKKNKLLDEDTSAASGRSLDEITAGNRHVERVFNTIAKRSIGANES